MAPMALPFSPPTTSDCVAQLQRVDTLHQRLKMETARSQEFLARIKRGEEAQAQSHSTAGSQPRHAAEDDILPPKSAGWKGEASNGIGRLSEKNTGGENHTIKDGVCRCQHHQSRALTEKDKKLAEDYRRKMPPLGSNFPPLPTHVDEREVRDLEKRVRGLEGRVRGFEGMPPDREMALLEVERLRRELEGLARRREGLFGLMDQKSQAQNAVMKTKFEADHKAGKNYTKGTGKTNAKAEGKKS